MLERETIAGFFNAMSRQDLEELGEYLADEAEFRFPKTVPLLGRKRILSFFAILFRRYPQLQFAVQHAIIEGNAAAVHWTNCGANRKGEPYENEGVTLLVADGGRIVFLSDFFKDTGKF